MTTIFEPGAIHHLILKNRLVRSATWEGMCDPDGRPTPKLADYYATLAAGGIGLIISGYAYVSPEGKQLPGKMGIYTDDFKDAFLQLTSAVHAAGGKIAIQLVHAGGQANPKTSGLPTVAPSAVKVDQYGEVPGELTRTDIETIINAFGDAAGRARDWGFDGVQIHGAHGYLVNQFLSPLTNRRTDDYGGSLENRTRFLREVYTKIREQVGAAYPVFIKLNAADNVAGGLTAEDGLAIAGMLSDMGMDALEISSGTPASGDMGPAREKIDSLDKEGYNLDLAKSIKAAVSCPVICVGGIRSFATAHRAIAGLGLDFVALSRPLIREPDLPAQWEKHQYGTAACISCNKCFMPGLSKGGIYCVPKKTEEKKT